MYACQKIFRLTDSPCTRSASRGTRTNSPRTRATFLVSLPKNLHRYQFSVHAYCFRWKAYRFSVDAYHFFGKPAKKFLPVTLRFARLPRDSACLQLFWYACNFFGRRRRPIGTLTAPSGTLTNFLAGAARQGRSLPGDPVRRWGDPGRLLWLAASLQIFPYAYRAELNA